MKVFLIVFSFIFFSFLGAEESTSAQNQPSEASAETPAAEASAETPAAETPAAEAPAETPAAEAAAETSEAVSDNQESAVETKVPDSNDAASPADNSGKQDVEVIDEQGYDLKLRALEEKINSLKDKIFRSKQRLAVLQETVLTGTISGSSVKITHKNAVGELFRLTSAIFYLDDNQVFEQSDSMEELGDGEFKVYEGAVVPGSHKVSAFYIFEGKGYGIFSYLKTYQFKLNDEFQFIVEEGNFAEIIVTPIDKGMSYNFKNRLQITFDMNKKRFDTPMEESGESGLGELNFASIADQVPLSSGEKNAEVALVQKNTVGGLFKLMSVSYSLDGAVVYTKKDAPEVLEAEEINLYEGKVASGRHVVKADCVFRGNGYGVFSYMKGYTFNLSKNYSFKVEQNTRVELVTSLEDKGAGYNVKNRLNMTFTTNETALALPETENNDAAPAQEE